MWETLGFNQNLGTLFFFAASIAVLIFIAILILTLYVFNRRRVRAVIKDSEDIADLAATRNQHVAEIEAIREWQKNAQEELIKLVGEREAQERLRQELQELEIRRAEVEQDGEAARKEVLDLQYAVTALAEERDRLKGEIEEARTARENVTELLDQKKEAEEAAHKAKQEVDAFQSDLDQRRAELEELRRQKAAIEADVPSLEAQQSTLQSEINRLESELVSKRQEAAEVDAAIRPLTDERMERARLNAEREVLEAEIVRLKDEHSELAASRKKEIASEQYADLVRVGASSLADDVFPKGSLAQISENDALANLSSHLDAQNLVFPERVLKSFHTSLKVADISPITVLAGISGTGKSELPMRYAEAMGMHSLNLAVQPSWSSPQDLFGFYNYLEKRYKATELARALVRMDPYNLGEDEELFAASGVGTRSDRMLLVLVDEMNLARVEYYFSEFLSKLEMRRAVSDPNNSVMRRPAEIELEGAVRGGGDEDSVQSEIRLWVGGNVLFAGTMNEDESTQTLSDKVLDRANVLRFGKPPPRSVSVGLRNDEFRRGNYLTHENWVSWQKEVTQERWTAEVNGWLETLNESLDAIGRPFGWRIREGIHQYIANYPGVGAQEVYKHAMADQVEQKIMPKLRGVDIHQQQAGQALNGVEAVLEELGDEELLTTYRACLQETGFGIFNWRGVTRTV